MVPKLQNRDPQSVGFYLICFLWPVYSLVMSLRNYRATWARGGLWFFVVFYGFTFVISDIHLDSDRYRQNLIDLSKQEVLNFDSFLSLLYDEETNYVDVLQPLVTFLVSRFTDNARVLFAIFGLIFGYFYSRNLFFLLNSIENRLKIEALPFVILFAMSIAIWQLNAFRFWTAAHIFVYGILSSSQARGSWRTVALCSISVFTHFSFVLPFGCLLIYLLIGNRLVLYFVLYFGSFWISQVSPEAFSEFSDPFPSVFRIRAEKYTSEAYLTGLEKANRLRPGNWYVRGRILAINYGVVVLLFYLLVRLRLIRSHSWSQRLLGLALVLGSSINLLGSIPSIGRFSFVFLMLISAAVFLIVQSEKHRVFPLWISLPFAVIVALFTVVEIRIGFDTIGLLTVVGNPLLAIFVDNDIPLIDLIK